MIDTFEDLDIALLPFGDVSLLILGDFYNFHLFSKKCVYETKEGIIQVIQWMVVGKFQLHELVEIVW